MALAKIGTSLASMETLESLGVPNPEMAFNPYSKELILGDGTVSGMGFPFAEWHWRVITAAQKAILKTYCTGQSEVVHIATMKNDGTLGDYEAVMIWTHTDNIHATRTLDFTLKFQRLIAE